MGIVSKVLELLEHKGAANGYADLNGSTEVPSGQVPNLDAAKITSGRFGKTRLEFTTSKLLLGAGVGADPTEIDVPTGLAVTIPSGTTRNINTDQRETDSVPYVKLKEILLNDALPGGFRISFQMKTNGGTVYAKVYKNSVAEGAEFSTTSTNYVTKTEDFTAFAAGDLIQIYGHSAGGGSWCFIATMLLCYDIGPVIVSTTNQDP